MDVEVKEVLGSWRSVADAANTTVGKEAGEGEPSPRWKRRILLAEHSPIRQMFVRWKWRELPSWVSVHFVRHKIGIEHFVKSQRTDRTGIDRTSLPQNAPVDHECIADLQAMISISRKRLCMKASPETRDAWRRVLSSLVTIEPELCSVCVRECVYRGFCPEFQTCGYTSTLEFEKERSEYIGLSKH